MVVGEMELETPDCSHFAIQSLFDLGCSLWEALVLCTFETQVRSLLEIRSICILARVPILCQSMLAHLEKVLSSTLAKYVFTAKNTDLVFMKNPKQMLFI